MPKEPDIGYIFKGKPQQPRPKEKKTYIKLGEQYAHHECYKKWIDYVKEHTKEVDLHPDTVELEPILEARILCGVCHEPLHKPPLKIR